MIWSFFSQSCLFPLRSLNSIWRPLLLLPYHNLDSGCAGNAGGPAPIKGGVCVFVHRSFLPRLPYSKDCKSVRIQQTCMRSFLGDERSWMPGMWWGQFFFGYGSSKEKWLSSRRPWPMRWWRSGSCRCTERPFRGFCQGNWGEKKLLIALQM